MIAIWILLGLVVAACAIDGFRHGVVRRFVELVGLVAVFVFASTLASALEPELVGRVGLGARASFFLSWIVVIVGGLLLVRLAAALAQKAVRLSITGWIDRTGGVVLGLAFGALICSCILVVILALPVDKGVKREIRDQPVASALLHLAPAVYDGLRGAWKGERFFELIEEHVEPAARGAAEQIRAVVDELQRSGSGSDEDDAGQN